MNLDIDRLIERRTALLDAWVAKQREIAALQAQASALLAERWELWHEEIAVAPTHRDAIERSMIAEYGAAGRMSQGVVIAAFDDARLLAAEFPAVREAQRKGAITPAHVHEILRESAPVREAIETGAVDADTLMLYEAAALEIAEHDTPARTRAQARRIAAALAGTTVVERHRRALRDRTVTVRSIGDGLVLLQAVLPEHLAVAILDRLTKMARHMKRHPEDRDPDLTWIEIEAAESDAVPAAIFGSHTFTADPFDTSPFSTVAFDADLFGADPSDAGSFHSSALGIDEDLIPRDPPEPDELPLDPMFHDDSSCIIHVPGDARTMDQLRADLFTDLLLASNPSDVHGTGLDGITATIQVTVAATTLAGEDDRPAELDRFGSLRPEVARVLAGSRTGWTRLFCDPTGLVTETDTYTPTEPMCRFLRAAEQHCRYPGCRRPVHHCQIDHNHDYAKGGRTRLDNLSHFCGSHHPLKHPSIPDEHRWAARQLPDRTVEWISPNGRVYRDQPARRVMFVPSAEPPSAASPPAWAPHTFPPPPPTGDGPPF